MEKNILLDKKGEYSKKELEIYEKGKTDALKSVLIKLMAVHQGLSPHSAQYKEVAGQLCKYRYTSAELENFCHMEAMYFYETIQKARRIWKQQNKLISELSQLSLA